ncbi:MAG: peptidoglycan bridge formation glycyltransferase FemA/FemB family protein [Candidatus Pacebacteria bacterium]|nr:peptidoglycan bridge formation glycyltransferase FemA/FemB family protein [Candidatus Paceibacterota bacterium]
MEIKEITSKDAWENFLLDCREKTFLQSWNWGEFQKTLGETVQRLGFFKGQNLTAACLVIKVKSKKGDFLLVPHGPAVKPDSSGEERLEILSSLVKELKRTKENVHYARIAPIWERSEANEQLFKELKFKQAPMHVHPELSWLLDITPSEEELLSAMRKTTRYLIKQGQKTPNLEIIRSRDIKDVEQFNRLYMETVKKHNFHPFSLKYLQNEFSAFSKDDQAVIFLAKHKGVCLASAIVIYWQGTGFYHQGASITSKIPAAYLMQWEAIKEARSRGCSLYNFWGVADVAPKKLKGHPWAGLTLFKQGFGGQSTPYVKTQDLPLSARYTFIRWFEFLRKRKRGF